MTIVEILEHFRIPYKSHGSSAKVSEGWVGTECPWCGAGEHMGFPINGRAASCWKCGSRPLAATISRLGNVPYADVVKVIPQSKAFQKPNTDIQARRRSLVMPNGATILCTAPFANFLQRRGCNPDEVIRLWGLRFIGWDGVKYAWRILLPVIFCGQVVSWTTRTIGDTKPKYISAKPEQELIDHKTLLYGHDMVRHTAIVVEGPFDAIAIGPGAVATFGTGVTTDQLAKIAAFPRRIICFDNEPLAQQRARKLMRALRPYPGTTEVITTATAKDPGEAAKAEIREIRKRYLEN